jgi:phosphonate transport system permease protein
MSMSGVLPSEARIAALRARVPRAFGLPLRERLSLGAAWGAFVLLTAYCFWRFDFSPMRFWTGLGDLGLIVGHMFPPSPGDAPAEIFLALLETIAMAFLGTLLAAIVAVPLAFLAAKNTFPFWLPRFAVPDTGTLSKLFSESIENIEKKQIEGVRAAGAGALQTLRFGVFPQVSPMFLSSALYMFESNIRSATILGIVGAGGIGFQLSDRIRAHQWEEASFILIVILIAVACLDWASKNLRMRLIGAPN